MAQGLTETGSEVPAAGITEEAHSLVAAPLTRVCPEEFSVGSSRQSSGRGQTWVKRTVRWRSMICPLSQIYLNQNNLRRNSSDNLMIGCLQPHLLYLLSMNVKHDV